MQNLKWKKAVYETNSGDWVTIYPEQLHDIRLRTLLRDQILWDSRKEQRLFVRYRPESPHFYAMSTTFRYIKREENSLLHKERVNELLSLLQEQDLTFGYKSFGLEKQGFVKLFKSKQYSWGEEVSRTMIGSTWRHDLFGAHSKHQLTENTPWAAIEVIDSHFPTSEALEAWLELSLEIPCFVFFDLARKRNYLFKVDGESKQVRATYFLHDGSIWKSGNRWKSCTAAFLEEKLKEEAFK